MDLISRQAAIDAISDLRDCENGYSDTYDKSCIIGVLEDLPSAQLYTEDEMKKIQDLEQAEIQKAYELGRKETEPEIIRCSQCRFAEVADKEDDQDGYTCQFHRGSIWFSGSYCSWAERRTDETN